MAVCAQVEVRMDSALSDSLLLLSLYAGSSKEWCPAMAVLFVLN